MTIMELGKLTDNEARKYLENLLWPNGPVCPHCKSDDCTRMHGNAHRPGCIQCNDCRKQFSVTVGTVMERSKISLSRWLMAFHLMCSSKKGFSALQLQRNLELGSTKPHGSCFTAFGTRWKRVSCRSRSPVRSKLMRLTSAASRVGGIE